MLITRLQKKISSLKERGGLRKIICHTGWLFTDRVLRMAASLIVGAWVARYLRTEQFGLLNYAIAWVGLFAPIANVGIDNLVVRNLVGDPLTLMSQIVIDILFGDDYQGAGLILAIHIWASLFVFIGVASQPWFLVEGLTKRTFYRTVLGAIINVLLNLFLIPKYAGVGAAIATVIAYAVSGVLANAALPQTRRIFKIQIKSLLLFG